MNMNNALGKWSTFMIWITILALQNWGNENVPEIRVGQDESSLNDLKPYTLNIIYIIQYSSRYRWLA